MSASALSMLVNDPDGTTHPNAIFIPGTVTEDNIDRLGGIEWVAYHSVAAFIAGDVPISGVSHHTVLDHTLYAAITGFAIPAGTTTYGQLTAEALVYLATNIKDVPGLNADGTAQLDPATGQVVMVSYFASATVVAIG